MRFRAPVDATVEGLGRLIASGLAGIVVVPASPAEVRVSLANLPDEAPEPIGQGIAGLVADGHAEWRARRGQRGRGSRP